MPAIDFLHPTIWEQVQGQVTNGANGIDGDVGTVAVVSVQGGLGNFASYGVRGLGEGTIDPASRGVVQLQVAATWKGASAASDYAYLWGYKGGTWKIIRRVEYPDKFDGSGYAIFDVTKFVGSSPLANLRFQIAPIDGPLDPPPTPPSSDT